MNQAAQKGILGGVMTRRPYFCAISSWVESHRSSAILMQSSRVYGYLGSYTSRGYSYHSIWGEKSIGMTGSSGIMGGFGGPGSVIALWPVATPRAQGATARGTCRRSMCGGWLR